MVENVLPNHIEEYFKNNNKRSDFLDLFESEENDVDSPDNNIMLRTDLTHQEIILVNVIILNANLMKSLGLKSNIYDNFINQYQRLKVSMDRKSRAEFVDINKKERFENNLDKFNAFQNLKKVKE